MKWKRIILWALALFVALPVGLAIVAIVVVKHSPAVRRGILARVERHAGQSTGAQIAIRDFTLNLSGRGINLEGIVVRKPGSQSAPPLLQIDQVSAEINIDSVFKLRWNLQNLFIDHPVIHIFADKSGDSNPPSPEANGSTGIATAFDLAIEKCVIDRGEIFFNDKQNRLEAEVYNLQLNARFEPTLDRSASRYHGDLSYDRGQIQYGNHAPVVSGMDASFTVTPSKLTFEKLAIVAGQSKVMVHGEVENFSIPVVHAAYDAYLTTAELARLVDTAALPEGMVYLTGSLIYDGRVDGPLIQHLFLAGDVSSPVVQVRMHAAHSEVRDLSASYKLAGGGVEIDNIRAQLLGGSLSGHLAIRDVAGDSHARVQAHLQDVSLEQIEATARPYSLPNAHLRGKASADTSATWNRSLADFAVHADATLEGTMGQDSAALVSGAFHGDYAAASHELELRQSYIRTPTSSLTLDGRVSRHSQLQVAARCDDLRQLELLAANLKAMFSGKPPSLLGVEGTASFNGFIRGSTAKPQLEGRLEARNLRVKGTSWKLLRANVDASPYTISISGGDLEAANQGRINFTLRTGLDDWVYTSDSPIHAEISLSQISLDDVEELAGQKYPLSGSFSGNVSVHGSQLNPLGHGDIRLADGHIFSEPIQSLVLKFQGDGNVINTGLLVRLPAGSAQSQITIDPKTWGYEGRIQAENLRLERLMLGNLQNFPVAGVLNLNAEGSGTLSFPNLKATVKVSQLRIQEQPLQELMLAASIHDQLAEITLNSGIAQSSLTGRCKVQIKPPFTADVSLDAKSLSLRPLLALYAPSHAGELDGETEFHASLHGPLRDRARLEAHIDIPVLTAAYQQIQLGAAKPIRVDYRHSVLTLQPASIEGTGTKVQMEVTLPVNDPRMLTYLVEGTVDLGLARLLRPDLAGSGQIQVDLDSRKHTAGSDLIGEVRLVNASLHSAGVPLGLDQGNGEVVVSRTGLEVRSFQAQVGGGTLAARGGVTLRPILQFDLGLSGSDIRVRYPEGVRAVLEPDLTLVGNKQEATVGGTVKVQRVSLTRDFDLLSFINQFDEMEYSAPPSEFARHVRLNVEIQSASQVEFASNKVSLSGNASLSMGGTAAEPVILGRANLSGGDLFLGGNRYVIQSGAIDFLNPVTTEAVVNFRVKTRIEQYDISLIFQGSMERLTTTYTSEPPLPPADIINLLAFGKTSEASGGNPAALGNLGAQSVLVQGLSSAVSSRVEKFAGLSYFSIDPALGGSNQNSAARIIIQERVTNNLVVTYSTDVTSIQRQAIQLEYRFNPRWSVSGVRDQNGGFGATASYRTTF